MRRIALTSLLACIVAALSAASGLGAPPPKRSYAKARLTSCKPALSLVNRSLTVDASMRAIRKGDRMKMRFDLFRKLPGAKRYRKLAGPGLGTWNSATAGVDRFRFRKPIQNLPAPAVYFVRVSYIWLDDTDVVHARTARTTSRCVQPDLRPDLRIVGLNGTRRLGAG